MSTERRATWPKATFIILCLLLGGASARGAGVIGNGLIQIIAALVIAAGFWSRRTVELSRPAKMLIIIFAAYLAFILLSLVPLPASLWQTLPGREPIARGYELLGMEAPALPLSLSWPHSLGSILWLLPPAAVFLLVVRSSARERSRLVWPILAFCAISIVLGVAQLLGGEDSSLRFYQITNRNSPVGFFSNTNHFATMLVCALPLVGYLAGKSVAGGRSRAQRASALAMVGAIGVFLLAGIGTIGSIAGYGLTLPSAFAGFLIYRKAAYGKVGLAWGLAAGLLVVAFLGLALLGPINSQRLSEEVSSDPSSRASIARVTVDAIEATFPAGTGLGTFQEVYRTFDDPNSTSREYTNHAHNDYLEIVLELGLVGVALVIAFLIWWAVQSLSAWRSNLEGSGLARAGSVMVFIVLLHSLVDYPLRTSAVSVLFAFACALLVPYTVPTRTPRSEESSESLRHLKA